MIDLDQAEHWKETKFSEFKLNYKGKSDKLNNKLNVDNERKMLNYHVTLITWRMVISVMERWHLKG